MVEEIFSQKLKLENIDVTRHYFFEEIERNKLICKKHKKVCTTLNYIKQELRVLQ